MYTTNRYLSIFTSLSFTTQLSPLSIRPFTSFFALMLTEKLTNVGPLSLPLLSKHHAQCELFASLSLPLRNETSSNVNFALSTADRFLLSILSSAQMLIATPLPHIIRYKLMKYMKKIYQLSSRSVILPSKNMCILMEIISARGYLVQSKNLKIFKDSLRESGTNLPTSVEKI